MNVLHWLDFSSLELSMLDYALLVLLFVLVIYVVKQLSEPAPVYKPAPPPIPKPVPKPFTLEQLKEFNGTDPEKPIYIGIRGNVYDVRSFKSALKVNNYDCNNVL